MSRRVRAGVLLCVAVAMPILSSCSRDKKKATPTATAPIPSAVTSSPAAPTSSAAAAPTTSAPFETSLSPSASPSPVESSPAVPSPAATPIAPPPDAVAEPTEEPPQAPAVLSKSEQTRTKSLLVAGPDLGPAWTASELASEDKHEQGDLCGIVTAGERDRLFEAAVDLTDDGDAAGRHELARYTGGAAGTAAATMVKLLTTCPVAKQDFDGQPAEVRVTPAGSSAVTFTLNFGPGAVTHGALVISAVGEHLSTSGAYAVDAKSALALATKIDVAARKKLGAA